MRLGPGTGTAITIGSVSISGTVVLGASSAVIGHVVTDSGSVTNATLSAETTKVIGVIRTSDGAGNLLTSNSTTPAAHFALDSNITSILGTAPTTVGKLDIKGADGDVFVRQTTGTNLHVVTDATSVTAATLSAETTKVIGVVRTSDGAGNLFTTNSTTYTAKFALDSNLLGTLGTAFSTAGKVDIKGADGDVFVRQTTGTNLHVVTDATSVTTATLGTETTKVIGTVRIVGNIGAVFDAATAASVPANGLYSGVRGTTALPTAVSDGQLVGAMADKYGRQVVINGAIRDLKSSQTTTISASTSETTIVTAAAAIFNDIYLLVISNTSATALRIDFRDTTAGTILFSVEMPASDTRGFSVPGESLPQTSVNTNWTAQCSASVTDVRIAAYFEKNK